MDARIDIDRLVDTINSGKEKPAVVFARAGISAFTQRSIMSKNDRDMRASTLAKLCKVLGIDMMSLIKIEEEE